MATGKENTLPITPLANAFHGLLNHSNSLQPIPFNIKSNFEYNSPQKEKPETPKVAESVLSPTKTHASMVRDENGGSPNKKSPNKRSPNKSPKGRAGLKHKRVKNLMQEVQSVKDFSKLQEEVNENRDKISSLQSRLTTVQKEKDSISTQLQIVEEIKQQLNQQLVEKNKQMDEVQADTEILSGKLTSTQKDLEASLKQAEHHSIKRARTEVVSELKKRESLTKQLRDLQEENKQAISNLEVIANKEKERAQEQEKTISILQQTCDETSRKYTALKRDFFISTCLAIKLNLSRVGRPVNIQVDELWELAEEREVPIEQFPKFITAEIRKRYEAVAVK